MPYFSLIVATIRRTTELQRLLGSLRRQDEDLEVIVVDQNSDDRLAPIISFYADDLNIRHLSSRAGAARARNAGLDVARGEIIAFPDDDCWYPPGLLHDVRRRLRTCPDCAGITGRGADEAGNDSGCRWLPRPAVINRFNIWRAAIEFTMFLRRDAITDLRFNAELGTGADTPWGAGEGTDFLLRLLARGRRMRYEPTVVVHHPSHIINPPSQEKALLYAYGIGRVMGLNRYPPALAAMLCLGPLVHSAVGVARLDFKSAALTRRVAMCRLAGYRAAL